MDKEEDTFESLDHLIEDNHPPIKPAAPILKPNTTPKNKQESYNHVVYAGNGVKILIERGNEYPDWEYPDWEFPVVVPNVLLDKKYTREQIKEIAFIHRTHCLNKPPLGHPDFESWDCAEIREKIREWIDLTENLFLEVDQSHFDHIKSGLGRKLPGLQFEWKKGVLWVNGGKTRIKAKNIDRAWKALRALGAPTDIEEFIIDLIGKQLSEIFVC